MRRSCNTCCSGKAVSVTCCECVFAALVIQQAMSMRRSILLSAACLALINFSTLSQKTWFSGKVTAHKMRVLIFSTNFVWNISFYEELGEVWSETCIGLHVKYPLSCQTLMKLEFSRQIFEKKILKYQITWKSVQWESSFSVRTDRHDEAKNRFSQCCKRA
jgi:hypothetical protein